MALGYAARWTLTEPWGNGHSGDKFVRAGCSYGLAELQLIFAGPLLYN